MGGGGRGMDFYKFGQQMGGQRGLVSELYFLLDGIGDIKQVMQEGLRLQLGQNVDVRDTAGKWVNGEVLFIRGDEIYLHYSGWSSKFDEHILLPSARVQTQWERGLPLRLNHRVDAYHPLSGWLEARVVEIANDQVKVHYFNYHPKYDRWLDPADPAQLDIIGARSKAYGIGKSRGKRKPRGMTLSQLSKRLLEVKVRNMVEELAREDLEVHVTAGDGNCLFRSVSHQLYGTEDHHLPIRLLCMNYIRNEGAFFEDYVTEPIERYTQIKSEPGQWGDDVEIEALSEIYGRPIEIYATSARPLRTFHEDNEHRIEPMRLAYVGSSHYNSIKPHSQLDRGLLDRPFGEYEGIFAQAYELRAGDLGLLQHRQFFSRTNGLDDALEQNVEAGQRREQPGEELMELENREVNKALELSETENILEQIEKSEVEALRNKYEQDLLQEELRRIEEKEMELARELSKKTRREPERPYWFAELLSQGFNEHQILFAIEVNGYDPDRVQNFLFDSM